MKAESAKAQVKWTAAVTITKWPKNGILLMKAQNNNGLMLPLLYGESGLRV
jgi:uncharacterized protein YeaC (DUF1315 family)